jgi:hypothetical protein
MSAIKNSHNMEALCATLAVILEINLLAVKCAIKSLQCVEILYVTLGFTLGISLTAMKVSVLV